MSTRRFVLALSFVTVAVASNAMASTPSAHSLGVIRIGSPPAANRPAPGTDRSPVVTSGRDRYLVLWENWPSVYANTARLQATVVGSNGMAIDPPSWDVDLGGGPAAVWDGERFVVAYLRYGSRFGLGTVPILLRAFSREGRPSDEISVVTEIYQPDCNEVGGISVSTRGSGYVVAWTACDQGFVAFASHDLEVLQPPSVAVKGKRATLIDFNETLYLAWIGSDLRATRISAEGAPLERAPSDPSTILAHRGGSLRPLVVVSRP